MLELWLRDIESLEAISQDDDARRILLRMAAMSRAGKTSSFLVELAADDEMDAGTKASLAGLAEDTVFLLALEEYLRRTHELH